MLPWRLAGIRGLGDNLRMKTQLALFACLVVACSHLHAQEDRSQKLWNLDRLSKPPKADWGETDGLIQSVKYTGESFNGKPTRVFAYVGRPDPEKYGQGPYPGMVLVHGGGGQAFPDWARHWAERGYVAIAMDTAGCGAGKARLDDGGPDQGHLSKFRNFKAGEERDMWTYHAVADAILAHSLNRSLPECDAQRTGLTGISWGGYLTCITAGIDTRFKAAVPVYGCGFLSDNSAWANKEIAGIEPDSRRLWQLLFDPGRHVGRAVCPMLFLNGTNDFAYPLDSYRKTIEQVSPELATVSIQVRLPHGHIWRFGVVDAFIDSHLRDGMPLAQLGELRVAAGEAYAPIVNDVGDIKEVKLLYTHDVGAWQERKWETLAGVFDPESGRLAAIIPQQRPVTFILQATDQRGNQTSTTHFHVHADVNESNPSLNPAPKLERDFYDWHRRHADALWVKREIDPDVVLIGDSITHMWAGRPVEKKFQRGVDSWQSTFGGKALNLGFGWDRTQNVLWRIDHGEIDGIQPKTVIVHIGTNNLADTSRHKTSDPAEVAEAIGEICRRVRAKLPEMKLIVMAVFPRGQKPDHPKREEIAEINKLLPRIVKKHDATLVDVTNDFLGDDGTISRDVMGDFLHPAAKGYQIWADRVAPLLAQ